ncbi:hypothetical protein O3M35_007262 [Rhynocoris fuscipes]|uniref:Lipase domain-containing protein n=1 Tax=Rhynocoris fuscipes TaxID=488301 RepID=A0AAW1DFX7_9HEMI
MNLTSLFLCYFICFSFSVNAFLDLTNEALADLYLNNIAENEENVTTDDVMYYLYTRKNPLKYEQLFVDNLTSVNSINFDKSRPVKILIHGWKNSHKSQFSILLKNAYLIEYNTNVIVVDWFKYSHQGYLTARLKVPYLGDKVAAFIDELCLKYNISSNSIHIVGHSLGAHIAGFAGPAVKSGIIARITGLDPAGPFFGHSKDYRISSESAKFVDIIHTTGATLALAPALGHADFYPNGGTAIQPGCGYDIFLMRSHRRSYWLFAESITSPNAFISESCSSWDQYKLNECTNNSKDKMGEHVSDRARGKYYLRTNKQSPFAIESNVEGMNSTGFERWKLSDLDSFDIL